LKRGTNSPDEEKRTLAPVAPFGLRLPTKPALFAISASLHLQTVVR
jgi:hypothetical protein